MCYFGNSTRFVSRESRIVATRYHYGNQRNRNQWFWSLYSYYWSTQTRWRNIFSKLCKIKKDNLTIGLGSTSGQIMMIDFGLAKFYRDQKNRIHKTFETDASFVGTARFCSRHTSKGETSSRRDDMESVAYTMICKQELYIKVLAFL